jgi:hypothetical protein
MLNMIVLLSSATACAQDLGGLSDVRPIGLTGSLVTSTTGYKAAGIDSRREPITWSVTGSPVLSIYDVQFPVNLVFSDQDQSIRQPFDQFGISPSYKWLNGHFGYRSLSFSRYTLAGVTFLGAGIEVAASPIRIGAMYGRLQRAVEEDTLLATVLPAYKRLGMGARVGFGSLNNFFDLILFRAKDDTTSLSRPIMKASVYPQENLVGGINTKIAIFDELSVEAEASASALTRDLRAPKIDSIKIPSIVSKLMDVNSSTSLTFAGHASMNVHFAHWATALEYERIEPNYSSLGAYFFNSDLESYKLSPSFDVFQGKLRVSGSMGFQHDDLLHTKGATTSHLIGSTTVSWNPSPVFGMDGQYSNYATDQVGGIAPLNDSVRVRNVSQSASLAPRLMVLGTSAAHVYAAMIAVQSYTDLNAFTNLYSNSKSVAATGSYTMTFLKSGRSIGGSLQFANTTNAQSSSRMMSVSIHASTPTLQKKLVLAGSIGYTSTQAHSLGALATSPTDAMARTISENVTANYQVSTLDAISLTVSSTQNTGSQFQAEPYQESTASMTYTRSFAF